MNLGDSKSFICWINEEDKFVIDLNTPHTPHDKEERFRIYWNGGFVERMVVDKHKFGPLRIWRE